MSIVHDDPVCLDDGRITTSDGRYTSRRAVCSGMWGVGATTHNSAKVTCFACMVTTEYEIIDAIRELAKLKRPC